jgi:GntR family histidine utilization transcriptional repressor
MTANSHHKIRQMLKGRIESGEWELGALIPRELALAEEYNCARTTINRALQALADEGVVVRKRKGGTRVCRMPVRHAKFGISILREQVEVTGSEYRHQNVVTKLKVPPKSVRAKLQTSESQEALFLQTIHLADNSPYAYEERWVNVEAVPEILHAPLDEISVNEWLVRTVPFSSGDVIFSAENADQRVAGALECQIGDALFVLDRTTWVGEKFITTIKLYYRSGYQLYSSL